MDLIAEIIYPTITVADLISESLGYQELDEVKKEESTDECKETDIELGKLLNSTNINYEKCESLQNLVRGIDKLRRDEC